jgi:hypothetical protein
MAGSWVNPSPAQTPRHLVIHGGFAVDNGPTRHLEQHARTLGFTDLRGYLQARSDGGLSIPELAAEVGRHPLDHQASPHPGQGHAATTS